MRHLYEREANTKVSVFQPIMYRTQVVAGVHYFIKVGGRARRAVARTRCLLPPRAGDGGGRECPQVCPPEGAP